MSSQPVPPAETTDLAGPAGADQRSFAGDPASFGRLIEGQRRDLVLLCYRFLGSVEEAEEAAQETALRAWRAAATFRGEATLRTWLHRIATRVCLDALAHRRRRVLPAAFGPSANPDVPPQGPVEDVPWLEPIPESFLVDQASDPAARYSLRESVGLAFLAALQTLPPRQRVVLILHDVLGWRAQEIATLLETTVGAANSALHRARAALRATHHRTGPDAMPSGSPEDPTIRRLLHAYIRAWEADDVDALVATLADDVRLAMPPSPSWYSGRAVVGEFLARWVLPRGRHRLRATTANGQPAVGFLERQPDGTWAALGIQVLTIDARGVHEIAAFMDPAVAARFDPGPSSAPSS